MIELLLEKGDVKLLMATLVTLLDMKYITEPKMIDKYKKLLKKLQETTAQWRTPRVVVSQVHINYNLLFIKEYSHDRRNV